MRVSSFVLVWHLVFFGSFTLMSCFSPTAPPLPDGAVKVRPGEYPANYAVWLKSVRACTGRTSNAPFLELYVVPNAIYIANEDGVKVLGLYIYPGKIVVSELALIGPVIVHEMVHGHLPPMKKKDRHRSEVVHPPAYFGDSTACGRVIREAR